MGSHPLRIQRQGWSAVDNYLFSADILFEGRQRDIRLCTNWAKSTGRLTHIAYSMCTQESPKFCLSILLKFTPQKTGQVPHLVWAKQLPYRGTIQQLSEQLLHKVVAKPVQIFYGWLGEYQGCHLATHYKNL